jgi:SAM-dependent methyltransferase
MRMDPHSQSYADYYVSAHEKSDGQPYRMAYWNHFFLDSLLNKDKKAPTHLLEEGGGTCGIWKSLSFDRYTSVDISEPMTEAARQLYSGDAGKQFIHGDIFSEALVPGSYSAIVANAYGVYYRPNLESLRRFHDLMAEDGLLFVAIDPVVKLKHYIASPVAGLIDRHVRSYTRIPVKSFTQMVDLAGLKIWNSINFEPTPGWHRQAFILTKG